MEMKDFYEFRSKYLRSTFQAYPSGLRNDLIDELSEDERLIKGLYDGINFPVIYEQRDGKKITDILDTGWPSRYLISERLRTILIDNYITGWKTYPIKLYDKKKNEIIGYYGFSVIGTCGPLIYDNAEIIYKQYVPDGPLCRIYKGESFQLSKWDKNDFFISEGTTSIIINKRAAKVLIKNKISNFKLERLDEAEIEASVLDIIKSYKIENNKLLEIEKNSVALHMGLKKF